MINGSIYIPNTEESILVREALWPRPELPRARKVNKDLAIFPSSVSNKPSINLSVHNVHPDVIDRMPLSGSVFDNGKWRTKTWTFDNAHVSVTFFT